MKLRNLASTVRSKNAGVDLITFDIIFKTEEAYQRAKRSPLLTPEYVARLYRVSQERIVVFTAFDPARAIKFTLKRERPSGSAGESDVFGAQQYAPLLDLEIG